jgi:hypothetical protein
MKFILGGKHLGYPGANGQFANAKVGFGKSSFCAREEDVASKIKTGVYRPLYDWGKSSKMVTVERVGSR